MTDQTYHEVLPQLTDPRGSDLLTPVRTPARVFGAGLAAAEVAAALEERYAVFPLHEPCALLVSHATMPRLSRVDGAGSAAAAGSL